MNLLHDVILSSRVNLLKVDSDDSDDDSASIMFVSFISVKSLKDRQHTNVATIFPTSNNWIDFLVQIFAIG